MSLAVSSSSGTFRLAAVSLPQGTLFFSHTKKKPCLFVLLTIFLYLWLSPKVLSLGKENKNLSFFLLFSHLFVPLAVAEGTLVRQ